MNDKLGEMWKGADVTHFKALARKDPALKKRKTRGVKLRSKYFEGGTQAEGV